MKEQRRPLLKHPVIRILMIWIIQAIALVIMALIMRDVYIESFGAALAATAVIGLLNALLWPLLSFFVVPFAVLTLGIGALILNGIVIGLAASFVDGFEVQGLLSAIILVVGMTAINVILSTMLTIDDDNSWYRNQVRRRMKRTAKPEETDVPGIIFLEIDGLAKPILEHAIAEGYAPTMGRWIQSGSHVLNGWETDTSSQTSASQAGILHGNNSNIPAFRWYDKASGQIIASSDVKALPGLEAELSDGNGLLSDQGASRGNLFSGDAPYVMATASTIRDRTKFHTSEFQAYFTDPYNFSRTLVLFFWDVFLEWRQFRHARNSGVEPILTKKKRGGSYPFVRAGMTVLMRELNIYTLLGDMFAGRPTAYATFVGYDEVAHHSGIYDPGAFDVLRKLDEQFARLESAIKVTPRPYHLVVLSDHGQTGGSTFKQRYGMTLQDFVQQLMSEEFQVLSPEMADEGASNVGLLLTDAIENDAGGTGKVVGRVFKSQMVDGEVKIDGEDTHVPTEEEGEETPDVIALASGNLGIISFTQWPHRATFEEMQATFPAVIPGLVEHEGVGFVMVRSEQDGAVVLGKQGKHFLSDGRIEGEDPLANFGANAAKHLARTDSFPNCPDIVVNSFYDPEKNEGCAFEELIGFHGGMGGTQTQPFILHPAELKVDEELIGAASVYRACKGWLDQLHNGNSKGETVPQETPASEGAAE